jgi:hypothetical protein
MSAESTVHQKPHLELPVALPTTLCALPAAVALAGAEVPIDDDPQLELVVAA